jgi:glycosyltransferase involved in cell wall biosynthesis
MKVLLFSNHYPASDAPTRGTYNHNIFNALGRTCEVRVVGPVPWWTRTKRPRDLVRVQHETGFGLDAAFPSFWSVPGVTPLHGHATFLTLLPYLIKVRAEFPFDVVVGCNAYPDGVGAADLAALARVPLVQNVIGSDVNELPDRPALRPQILWALRRADRVVAVSHDMAARVVELGIPRERVLGQHNGVDGETFALRDKAEARRRVGIDAVVQNGSDGPPRPVILYVGNVKIAKGVKVLVEAMAPLAQRHGRGDALLCVVGSGEADAEIAARVRELGLEKSVRLCGRQLHTEIPWWMSACDLFCLPSYMEGCPNVVLEALASGRGVVASRVGGIPELCVEGKNGVLVPPRDPEALAAGLAQALGRPWDPEAQRASVQYLSHDAVAAAYRGVLEQVLAERGR